MRGERRDGREGKEEIYERKTGVGERERWLMFMSVMMIVDCAPQVECGTAACEQLKVLQQQAEGRYHRLCGGCCCR